MSKRLEKLFSVYDFRLEKTRNYFIFSQAISPSKALAFSADNP
jgi:hypothetical protein